MELESKTKQHVKRERLEGEDLWDPQEIERGEGTAKAATGVPFQNWGIGSGKQREWRKSVGSLWGFLAGLACG